MNVPKEVAPDTWGRGSRAADPYAPRKWGLKRVAELLARLNGAADPGSPAAAVAVVSDDSFPEGFRAVRYGNWRHADRITRSI